MTDMQKWAMLQYCNALCLANVFHPLHTAKRWCTKLFFTNPDIVTRDLDMPLITVMEKTQNK